MNKGLFSFSFIFIALFVSALYFSNPLQAPFISSLNSVKISFHQSIQFIDLTFQKYLFQSQHIEHLNEKLQQYQNNEILIKQLKSENNNLLKLNNSKLKIEPNIELVRTISYQKFGDLNRVWIDIPDYNSSKIYGLIYKGDVAGIIIDDNKRALALLNKDIKSTYAVYVGQNKAPGIAHGNNTDNLIVKFIPAWIKINIGDKVITSGLDNIFFKGLKVGEVTSVTTSQGYQNAIVKPYYNSNNPNYFHMIRSIK